MNDSKGINHITKKIRHQDQSKSTVLGCPWCTYKVIYPNFQLGTKLDQFYSLNHTLQVPWIAVVLCQSGIMTNLLSILNWSFVLLDNALQWKDWQSSLFYCYCLSFVIVCLSWAGQSITNQIVISSTVTGAYCHFLCQESRSVVIFHITNNLNYSYSFVLCCF